MDGDFSNELLQFNFEQAKKLYDNKRSQLFISEGTISVQGQIMNLMKHAAACENEKTYQWLMEDVLQNVEIIDCRNNTEYEEEIDINCFTLFKVAIKFGNENTARFIYKQNKEKIDKFARQIAIDYLKNEQILEFNLFSEIVENCPVFEILMLKRYYVKPHILKWYQLQKKMNI